jgi:hypothetical protein
MGRQRESTARPGTFRSTQARDGDAGWPEFDGPFFSCRAAGMTGEEKFLWVRKQVVVAF